MRVSVLGVVVGVLAAASGWMARGFELERETASPLSTPTGTMSVAVHDAKLPERVVIPDPAPVTPGGTRNLFAYPIQEPGPRPVIVPPVRPAVVDVHMPVLPPQVEERPRIRFTYRYIGRFGPDGNSVAAFSRDGEIVTAKIGDRIDQNFVLRSIGIESVEVEALVGGERHLERVELWRVPEIASRQTLGTRAQEVRH